MPTSLVPVSAIAHPFDLKRVDYEVPAGLTIAEIIEYIQPDPILREHGVVFIGEQLISKEYWNRIRPKPGTLISIRLLPKGGGALRMVAMVALVVVATVATFYIGGLPGALVGAGIMAAGTFAINTLLPAPVPQVSKSYGNDKPSYAIAGQQNQMRPWEKLAFLGGTFKITPAYAAQPWQDTLGGNVNLRCMFAIAHGPVAFGEMRIGDTPLSSFTEVDMDYRRGYWTLADHGWWDASTGVFPSSPTFGDTWTVQTSGSVAGFPYAVGETITFNALEPATSVYAWDKNQGQPYPNFPSDTAVEALNAQVKYSSPVIRTTSVGADNATIQLVFERGLAFIQNSPPGKRGRLGVAIRIEQSPVGANTWSIITETSIFGTQTTPMYWSYDWSTTKGLPDPNKQYDIRITRLSADADEDRFFSNFTWGSLTTFGANLPTIPGIATVCLRIKASGQLAGTLNSFNLDASSMAKTWNGTSWEWAPTNNPAAIFRHMLQHPTSPVNISDAQLDLSRLQEWSEFCDDNDHQYDGVIESKQSLYDALIDVSRIGVATPTLRDLKYSVIIDEPKTAPVRLFTPRNSWNYHGEMSHAETPHAYRIGFVNADRDWATEEVIAYDDGRDATNATKVERIEWIGITDRARAWRAGRRHLAEQRLRREVHTIDVDFEHLVCERGDLVALQHDAIAVGLGSMRVTGIVDNGVTVSAVHIDGKTKMEVGKSYGFRARRVVSGAQRVDLFAVNTVVGQNSTLTFPAPIVIADAPKVGDLISFGEFQSEIRRVLIRDIEPHADLSATLTLIDEAPGVHTSDVGTIPTWDPGLTVPKVLPAPVVLSVSSDELTMAGVGGRAPQPRVVFTLEPISIADSNVVVLFRPTGTDGQWLAPTTVEQTPNAVAITGAYGGDSYDFRIGRTHRDYLPSPMTQLVGTLVIGRSVAPAGLQNMNLASIAGGTTALIRWDPIRDLDVQFGGRIEFRHSALSPDDATWGTSRSIGQTVNGDQTSVHLPLLPGAYLARVYDVDGNQSETTAVAADLKQMSAQAFTPFAGSPIAEQPTFSGIKENCEVSAGVLKLSVGNFDDVPDVDALSDWDTGASGYAPSAAYKFANYLDLGAVNRARITARVLSEAVSAELVDGAGGSEVWDLADDVDGVNSAPVDVQIWGKLTDDDPAGTPAWGEWKRIDCMDVQCRAIGQLEARLTTNSQGFNVIVSELELYADHL